jgi:hypothetical protein
VQVIKKQSLKKQARKTSIKVCVYSFPIVSRNGKLQQVPSCNPFHLSTHQAQYGLSQLLQAMASQVVRAPWRQPAERLCQLDGLV